MVGRENMPLLNAWVNMVTKMGTKLRPRVATISAAFVRRVNPAHGHRHPLLRRPRLPINTSRWARRRV